MSPKIVSKYQAVRCHIQNTMPWKPTVSYIKLVVYVLGLAGRTAQGSNECT
jgi:hypothetical protein